MRLDESCQVDIRQIVAPHDDECLVLEELLTPLDASRVSPELLLPRPVDLDAEPAAIAEVALNLIAEIVDIDHDLVETVFAQQLDDVLHHRAIYDRHQRLRQIPGQGIEP